MTFSLIQTYAVSESSVKILHDVLTDIKNYPPVCNTFTRNGFQSYNVISRIPNVVLQELCDKSQEYLNLVVKNCTYYESYIDYLHLIHYNTGGWQEGHTHNSLEDYSFILYLNNSDGDTVIYEGKNTVRITPEYGKIVFFSSNYFHESSVCFNEKKVAVGSLRFRQKIWKSRQ